MKLDLTWVEPFLLVLTRVSGVVLVSPGFSSNSISPRVKIVLAVGIAGVMTAGLRAAGQNTRLEGSLPLALASDFIIGLVIGFSFRWAMEAVSVAGELVGLQMGLGAASIVDPNFNTSAVITESLFAMLFIALFMGLDGHLEVLRALRLSYEAAPLGKTIVSVGSLEGFASQTGYVVLSGLRLAAPFIIPGFLLAVSLALISKAFPQANVFSLSFPVTLLGGLVLIAVSGPAIRQALVVGLREGARYAQESLRVMAP